VTYGGPKALLIGACVEVWADHAEDWNGQAGFPLSARRNYLNAQAAWLHSQGVPESDYHKVLDRHAIGYSVAYLISQGERETAVQKLAAGGSTIEDIPELRRQALRLIPEGPPSTRWLPALDRAQLRHHADGVRP
jgi:hypothetical protein